MTVYQNTEFGKRVMPRGFQNTLRQERTAKTSGNVRHEMASSKEEYILKDISLFVNRFQIISDIRRDRGEFCNMYGSYSTISTEISLERRLFVWSARIYISVYSYIFSVHM